MPDNCDSTSNESRRDDSRRVAFAQSRQRSRRVLFVMVVLCAAGVAIAMFLQRGRDRARHQAVLNTPTASKMNPETLLETWRQSFSGPAFSSGATIEELEQEAMRVVDELVQAYPDTPDSLHQMARLQYSMGKTAAAVKTWRRCLELDPDCVDAYYGIGYVAWEKGEYAQSADLFAEVAARRPDDGRIPFLRGDSLLKQGKMHEAIAVLEKSVQTETASVSAVVCLAQAYLQSRQFEKAIRAFQVAIEKDPEHKQAHYGLATAYARLGRTEESRQCMQDFKTLAAQDLHEHGERIRAFGDAATRREIAVETCVAVGTTYLQHGDLQKAERLWQRAVVLAPDNVDACTRLARLYDQQSRFDEAIQVYQLLCQLEPKDGDHWLDMGVLYGRVNRLDAALDAITRAMELDPKNAKYRQAYELIKQAN